ncbi:MAG: polysaccharide lyase family 7 protein [Pseudomonadota bacterium]
MQPVSTRLRAALLVSALALSQAACVQTRLSIASSNVSASSSEANLPGNANDGSLSTGLNPSLQPGGNFNLSIWNLQLPSGSPRRPDTISPTRLEGGYTSQYFYTDSGDGAMTFWTPEQGVTTPNSNYPRSELREMNTDGSAANWDLTAGTHTLNATLRVVQVPKSVAIGQIKIGTPLRSGVPSSTKPTLELYYRANGDIYVGIQESPTGSQPQTFLVNVPLNTTFTYQIKSTSTTLTVTINGREFAFPLKSSFLPYGQYFKAGSYIQSTSSSATIGARVKFYALTVTHP